MASCNVIGSHVDFMAAILDFLENSKLLKINQKLIKNIENVSILFKLSTSIEKLEIKMHFKKFHVKILKNGF